jgi:hypothetical protein
MILLRPALRQDGAIEQVSQNTATFCGRNSFGDLRGSVSACPGAARDKAPAEQIMQRGFRGVQMVAPRSAAAWA